MVVPVISEESAEVEVLEARLAKTVELTTKIAASLARLQLSGTNVETAVKPIYGKTTSLTIRAQNIDATLAALDRVRKPADIVSVEEATIKAGPQKVGLSEYLACLNRLNAGLQSLKQANMRSQQTALKRMTDLLKAGTLEMENLFRQALAEDSNAVEPLHYITKELPFPTFSAQKINVLVVLNNYLSSPIAQASGLDPDTPSIYAQIRSTYLVATLSSLSQATLNTAQRSPTDKKPYDKGSNGIIVYLNALEAIFAAEYENICHLFPSNIWTKLYASTVSSEMSALKSTIFELDRVVKANLMLDCFLAFDVIETVTPASSRLGAKTGEKEGFADALKPIRQTAQASFAVMLEDVRKTVSGLQTLPADNGVLEITQAMMGRLRRLTDYKLAITGLLIGLGDGNWKSAPTNSSASLPSLTQFDVGADGTTLLAHFCNDVIDALMIQLEAKAKTLIKKPAAVSVLLINNAFYVESQVKRSELGTIMAGAGVRAIESRRKKAVESYMEPWKEAAAFVTEERFSNAKKEKDSVKDKFKNFNALFEELVNRHKAFFWADKDVSSMMRKEVAFIVPIYAKFWDKYKEGMRDKYVKWDKQGVEQIVSGL
ncbi:hypothetical protein BJ508DRAFT_414332 [Ascobolus immersus RN42]|uniref:Exocyst complex protein EXO70 n=1 Tax=Ascobolus immersus RN42 TaxID=1160509 RepID=A0A3N4I7M6_ASCIM|nr:hypothetical protein BJ508DRAFT_414332 [Ascobolus immersus RN42]